MGVSLNKEASCCCDENHGRHSDETAARILVKGKATGHGLLQHQRQLLLHRGSQRTPVHPQKSQCVRPSLVLSSKTGASSCGGGAIVKFTPNVGVKSEPVAAAKTVDPGLTSSGFGIEGLLLRSLHNRESTQQGQLFLPITIPFNRLAKLCQGEQQQQEVEADESVFCGSGKVEPQQELEDIDTAASTPSFEERKLLRGVKQQIHRASSAHGISPGDGAACLTASFLTDRFHSEDTEQVMEEDGRPEFLQLCFPELFPPLDISAMQAQQSADEKPQRSKSQQHSKTSRGCSRSKTPTPLQALPSGRIGQLLIRRSGRVHLRLLTEASQKTQSRDYPATLEEQQKEMGQKAELRNGEISYDVLVGTEGSFAQVSLCPKPAATSAASATKPLPN
ncbi:hypothetical protein Emag_002640 [Eimeria magna]